MLERFDLTAQHALVVPLACERVRALQDFDRLERLLQHQELVGQSEPLDEIRPVVVRVRGAHDDLDVRVRSPHALDGFEPVPTGRHAHVHECERVMAPLAGRGLDHLDGLLTLQGEVDLKRRLRQRGLAVAEQNPLGALHRGLGVVAAGEDLREIVVNGRVVVHDQDAVTGSFVAVRHRLGCPEYVTRDACTGGVVVNC